MMNYVAIQLTSFCVAKWENPAGSNSVGTINATTKAGWFPELFGQQYMLNVIIVLALAVFMYIYLRYTKHGYEIAVVGESENTARYIGIDVGGSYAHHGPVRRGLRSGGLPGRGRSLPHHLHQHGGRPRLHRHHRGVAGQIQHLRDDTHLALI
jgi:hypothetical protein